MKRQRMTAVCLLTIASCVFSTLIHSQTEWTKYDGNPVVIPGNPGAWDESFSVVNTILVDQNNYKMWYEGDNGFGYATSVDGIIWIKDSVHNPVLEPGPPGSWDALRINQASVLLKDSLYHLWYSGVDTLNDNRIGHATSPDGISWTRDPLNPVLDKGNPGSWDDEEVMHPHVLFEDGTFKMWYNGHDGVTQRILYATSPDGSVWTRFTQRPILEPGLPGQWDDKELGPLCVVHFEQTYHMWYTGWNQSDSIQIGYAASTNGIDWIKDTIALRPGAPGTWDALAVALPFVVVDIEDTLYKMWYGGTEGTLFQTGYATSGFVVHVENEDGVVPEGFVLYQNYPNPFNPETTIKYQIPSTTLGFGNWNLGFISLKVYDILGREVTTIFEGIEMPGEHTVSWDASGVAAGVYLCRLATPKMNLVQKMVVMK